MFAIGRVVFIKNVTQVQLPKASVTANVAHSSQVMSVLFVYGRPFTVAVIPVSTSKKDIRIPVVYTPLCTTPLKTGGLLSIQSTVAITDPVFPPISEKVNVNVQLSVNVYQVVFILYKFSFRPVSVTTTLPLVQFPDIGA